jgi:hypothetical protein
VLVALILFLALSSTSFAQLSGSYSVGPSGTYSTIDAAITALNQNGVSGPVTFLIQGGTYTPPAGGYLLSAVTGMSSSNTVTFKPASGATVTISGTTNNGTAIFAIDGGKYYIIDGSNSTGGTTRDMTLRQTSTTYSATIWMRNDADFNIVKNAVLQSSNGTGGVSLPDGGMTVYIAQSNTTSGNDSNTIQNNLVGDPNGTYRGYRAIYCYGASTSYPNVGTKIFDNDVVNFGNAQANCFGIFISYHNQGAIVRGNTVRMTTASGTSFNQAFGLYCNEQYLNPSGNSANVTFERNKVYGLQTTASPEYIYDLYYVGDFNTNSSHVRIINNMFASDRGTTSTTYYGMLVSVTSASPTVDIYYNSMYLAGSGSYMYMLQTSSSGTATINHKNNIYYSTWTGPGYGLYANNATGWSSNYNLLNINLTNSGAYTGYFNASAKSLTDWQTVSGGDANSISADPHFVDPSTGNLHINAASVALIESAGTPISGVTNDYDNDTRNTVTPDIGADEGNFNGGGIRVLSPNGGEQILAESAMSIQYSTNRSLNVKIQLSTDNGGTWSDIATVPATGVGTNSYSFNAPDVVTTRARMRVFNVGNPIEGDTSDAAFTFVRPTVTVVAPNGGEKYYQGENVSISWTSVDVPANKRVMLEYSVDGGGSWNLIATNLVSLNSPTTNTYQWIAPVTKSDRALIRVSMTDKATVNDVSDNYFSILKTMNLLSPNGGEQWFVGDKKFIKWAVTKTNYLRIQYSTDAGVNWTDIMPSVPAYLDSVEWKVPNTPTNSALVRIINRDLPTLYEQSAATFSILRSDLAIVSPNGGEKYDLNQAVTVQWTSLNVNTLRIEFSSNYGSTWQQVAAGVPAGAGSYTFTPPQIPTRVALVRVINEERPTVTDQSDRPFEIMEAKSISVLAPGQGDMLTKGSTTVIMWDAPRITSVNIQYSSNGGVTWSTLASNVPATQGSFVWTVPTVLTTNAKIRILEASGPTVGESGIFSVVDQGVPTVKVLKPNGGEQYTVGDPVVIQWSASSDLSQVSLSYSSNSGSTWNTIATGIPATLGQYNWVAPNAPGTAYRVKIDGGTATDQSDADFSIARKLVPTLSVLAPNGGENLKVGDVETIRWDEQDISAPQIMVSFSTDNGSTWNQITTLNSGIKRYDWTVPDNVTNQALVRVSDGTISDQSDAVFTITAKPILPIVVTSPNGGENWMEKESRQITWTGPDDVAQVNLEYSTDNGQTWTPIGSSSSVSGANSFTWTVPQANTSQALVKITSKTDAARFDVSDQPFTITYSPLSVPDMATTGAHGMTLVGNFPNPFANQTEVRWIQPASGDVTLRLYEGSGRLVGEYGGGVREAGMQRLTIAAGQLSSGLYYYELRGGAAVARGTMMIAR